MVLSDEELMNLAYAQAVLAAERGEVPIGAVIYDPESGEVLAEEGNRTIERNDPTAHAEVLAIRYAGNELGNYRLTGCELFVTLEPCAMCAGAISFARLSRVVYAAPDPKGGGVAHGGQFFEQPTCHHRPVISSGIMADECGDLLRAFFKARRK